MRCLSCHLLVTGTGKKTRSGKGDLSLLAVNQVLDRYDTHERSVRGPAAQGLGSQISSRERKVCGSAWRR